jgi:putative peptidoglycan lipid II flippase
LLAFSLVNILARAFYALGDTKTPMQISIFCLVINLIFALTFVWKLRQGGLGLANTISACFNVSLLLYALRRKLGRLEFASLRKMMWPILTAGAAAAVIAALISHQWGLLIGHKGLMRQIGEVFVPMTAATLVYLLVALLFKVPPAIELWNLILHRFSFGKNEEA